MKGFLTTKVGRRFLRIFFALSLPLVVAGWLGLRSATSALELQTRSVLRVASNGAEAQLREFLLHLKQKTLSLSEAAPIRETLQSAGSSNADISEILTWQQRSIPEAKEIFILAADGHVVASSQRENIGKDYSAAECFARGRQSFFPGDIHRNVDGQISWLMAAPIKDVADHRVLGVAVLRIDPGALSALTTGRRIIEEGADTQSFRIGNTGETYIVDRDRLMITESRDVPDSILNVKVDTLPVRMALEQGREISSDYLDYRGKRVSGASIFLRDMNWVVLMEIDFSQAFAPIRRLRNLLIGLAILLGLSATIVAWGWARAIVRPLRTVSEADAALAAGDETGVIASEENLPDNEIGEFVRNRNARIKTLIERQRELTLEQKRRTEAAAELEHMSYSMVHDMRAPLRAIISFGGMLEAEGEKWMTDETRDYIKRMRSAAARMDHLICDMLRYSALVRAELPLKPINISELFRSIIETYPLFQPHKMEIHVPSDLPTVQGNEAALTQCFSSLLENAVQYVEPGRVPKISIRTEKKSNDSVRIFVEDNGIGIPSDLQAKIFDIFQRGNNSRDGTGIGLAVARIAAARMGGRVGVISELGQGSRFWIELRSAG
jgi:signal transduction histidine kinase